MRLTFPAMSVLPHTWAFQQVTATGPTPAMFVPVGSTLKRLDFACDSGTATFNVQTWNGSAWVDSVTGLSLSSTAGSATPNLALPTRMRLNFTAISTPVNVAVTALIAQPTVP